ncbi:putative oxidoreductase CzcO [Anaerolineae bacterium]|nr:putative oxidoreductase CzcO [Anaerolineae bacterium]
MERIETVIVGGGQAGLSLSYFLTQQRRAHVILERAEHLANTWRHARWDSFTLVTPNWQLRLPGFHYAGNDPDGFLPRAEIVAYLEEYARTFNPPVRFKTRVMSVDRNDDGYRVTTDQNVLHAKNVVVATGLFERPKLPPFSTNLPRDILQLHSSEYRNERALPPGAILVVGSAQSGCQIAEELYQAGRKVYLCVGTAGRVPRRYRGKDSVWWLTESGFFDQPVDTLPSPKAKFAGNPHLSGKNGGHSLNLHQFARDGVTLLGRLNDARDDRIYLASNLHESLAKVDQIETDLLKMIDDHIEKHGLNIPKEPVAQLRDGYAVEEISQLDLASAQIKTIIWSAGYAFDFGWVHLPVFDNDGYPIQKQGITNFPGLYFLGLNWLHKRKSALFLGVGEDAAHIAGTITSL